jgi:predicted acetyltransferase
MTAGSSNNAPGFRKNNFFLNKPHKKKPQGLIRTHWYFCSKKLRYEVVAISSHGIIRRFFFDNTVNTNRYMAMLPNNLTPQLLLLEYQSTHNGLRTMESGHAS